MERSNLIEMKIIKLKGVREDYKYYEYKLALEAMRTYKKHLINTGWVRKINQSPRVQAYTKNGITRYPFGLLSEDH